MKQNQNENGFQYGLLAAYAWHVRQKLVGRMVQDKSRNTPCPTRLVDYHILIADFPVSDEAGIGWKCAETSGVLNSNISRICRSTGGRYSL